MRVLFIIRYTTYMDNRLLRPYISDEGVMK